ncbi:NfeD family protein [Thioclava sp. FR2]|uniref:NfeD family protein n=1 Tax=Thioclava sp. FR2 TaxID=3445780 RepID=UPI003EB99A32
MMWAVWWVWIVAGFALGVLEVIAPGYIFLGFAIGAVVVGAGLGVGLLGGSLPALLLVFALASLAAWYGLRRTMGVRETQVKIWDRDINDN